MADGRWHPLLDGCPPEWASEWGQDRYGVFVGFSVGEVEQRMRWIPSGTFMMGSPEDEPGRSESEGRQHLVTISRGFWLADTPVTQALWTAVMSENPSRFKGDDRPVEGVSWDDGQRLCAMLNERIRGLNVSVPSEAQWEYACRAGTTQATYMGNPEGVLLSSVLETVAWYRDNSDSETHPVKQKQPNPWGLYDMLGNVFEWCLDGRRTYDSEPQQDPLGPMQSSVGRVSRGGSWVVVAGCMRAAYRLATRPDLRDSGRGLRLVRDQAVPAADAAGQTVGAARRRA